jgi:hypothetical protein
MELRKIFWPKADEVTRLQNEILRSVLLTKYHSGDQTKKNDMGKACSTYLGKGDVNPGFWWGNLRKRYHLEDLVSSRSEMGTQWIGLIWLRIGGGRGCL